MSEVSHFLDSLEVNLYKVLEQLETLKQENQRLKSELNDSQQRSEQQSAVIADWEGKYESLKMANSILGSSESAKQAKLKINTLIREIDHCIAQLSE